MLKSVRSLAVIGLSVALATGFAGCAKKKPVEIVPNPDEEAARRRAAMEESLRVARDKARADSLRLAQEAQRTRETLAPLTMDDIYFDYDQSNLRSDAEATMSTNAAGLSKHGEASVTIEGHCDERGTNEYNLALGERRAASARSYLVNYGIDGGRLNTVSYGEERPVDPGHDEAAWAKNRRVHFDVK